LESTTKPYQPPDRLAGKVNLTDPDSRLVKAVRGWIQGYNAQAAVNEHQIVLAAEVTIDSPDFGHLEPMVEASHEATGASANRRKAITATRFGATLALRPNRPQAA